MKILVTGACGVTSRSVVRSLKMSPHFTKACFVGTDICENIYGLYEGLYDRIYKVSSSTDLNYSSLMLDIIEKERPDAAIIIPEPEVLYWSKENFPVPFIVPPPLFCELVINKGHLYRTLDHSGCVPMWNIFTRSQILEGYMGEFSHFPLWMRDFSTGSTSGKGALKIHSQEEARAWATINRGIDEFMVSEFLGGGNYACHLLYDHGEVLKVACYERLIYFMGKVVPSGVSGNISEGRLINNPALVNVAKQAVDLVLAKTGEVMRGIVAVDLKADNDNHYFVTEVNIRHVAATYAFASAGFNIAEAQLLLILNRRDLITAEKERIYPHGNKILRDIDGLALWIPDCEPPDLGGHLPDLLK